ncbi:MAG TPA: hypothetical protein VFI37_15985, partial [Gaiellaceae bacterium]|nr:hypothetical protein [Gaiellaceae bacterium]
MPPLRNHVAHVVLAALLFVLGVAAASGAKLPALGKSPRASKPPTAVTQKSRLHWDGKIFTSKHRFRGYLVSRGVNWRNFAQFHPAAIRLLQNGKCRSVKNCGAPAGTTTTAPPAPTTTS